MPGTMALDLPFPSRTLRLETLIRLRWMALAGQATAVLAVYFGLGFPLPLWSSASPPIAVSAPGQHRAAPALSRRPSASIRPAPPGSWPTTSSSSPSCSS